MFLSYLSEFLLLGYYTLHRLVLDFLFVLSHLFVILCFVFWEITSVLFLLFLLRFSCLLLFKKKISRVLCSFVCVYGYFMKQYCFPITEDMNSFFWRHGIFILLHCSSSKLLLSYLGVFFHVRGFPQVPGNPLLSASRTTKKLIVISVYICVWRLCQLSFAEGWNH